MWFVIACFIVIFFGVAVAIFMIHLKNKYEAKTDKYNKVEKKEPEVKEEPCVLDEPYIEDRRI